MKQKGRAVRDERATMNPSGFLKRNFDQLILKFKYFIKYLFFFRVNPKRMTILPGKSANSLVSVVICTHGDLPFFRLCLANSLACAGYENAEFIVWNNNAGAETSEFLASITDPRVRVIESANNLGLSAYHLAFKEAKGEYYVCLDHDVIKFSDNWLRNLVADYARLPKVKFMACDTVSDEYTGGARWPLYSYQKVDKDGMSLLFGTVGGWCSITDREIYEAVGGFPYIPDQLYFYHDKYFIRKLLLRRYKTAIDRNVRVYHACGVSQSEHFFSYVDSLRL